jgi:hypothetical protein
MMFYCKLEKCGRSSRFQSGSWSWNKYRQLNAVYVGMSYPECRTRDGKITGKILEIQ